MVKNLTAVCLQRLLLRWFGLALLLATMVGCASGPSAPRETTLAGVVVDGRLARPDEAGHVQVNRNGSWIEARANTVLQDGDWISTGPNAHALIRFPSGSQLYLRPNTRGRIGSFSEMVGEVFAKIRGAFAVQTTFVKAGAEGTEYSVRASQSGEYAVAVYEGKVRLSSLANAWPPVLLDTGSMAAGRPQVPPRPGPTSPMEAARTRAWVEMVDRVVPPAPKTSSVGPALAILGAAAVIAIAASDKDDLAAPTGLAPGASSASEPTFLRTCRSITLSWQPVKGASDYLVTMEHASGTRATAASGFGPAATRASSDTTEAFSGSYGTYRWHVQARDSRGKTGPRSAPAHFYCPG